MRTFVISITGLGMVAAIPTQNCTLDDYQNEIGWDISIPSVAECLSATETADDWTTCFADQPVSESCADDLGTLIADADTVCNSPCESINSTDCRICQGVVAMQQIAVLVPDTPYGMCGSESDRNAIMDADWSTVAEGDSVFDLIAVANVSELCGLCMTAWNATRPNTNIWNQTALDSDYCGPVCTDDAGSADCLNCLNVWWVSSLAYCSVTTWTGTCKDSDYASLAEMNPSTVKVCLEENAENEDALFHCLTDGTSVNLTQDCAAKLDGEFDYLIDEVCDTTICTEDNLSADCINCHGAVMVQDIFENAPEATGACGGSDDRDAMANVDMVAVIACGSEQASTGATCLGFQAEVSEICQMCLEEGTERAMKQCEPHCAPDAVGLDCMECVNYGLMSAAAYCNAHSGVAGMMGSLSLVSFVAIISFVLSA